MITNKCPWCRSIFSTRLDAQHHACSSFLHGFCRAGGSHVQTEIKQQQLPVECPLCKIGEVANQESESSSLPHAESVLLQFSSVSDFYDHITRCHLSLPGIPRARFAKVAQFRSVNTVPTARPFPVGNARRIENHVPRRGSERRKTHGWNLCSPKSVIESQNGRVAWERISRSDDGNGLSKYRRCSEWLRENTWESISRLTGTSSRTHRTSERSSRRAPAAVCPIQTSTRRVSLSHMAGGGRRGLIPTVRSSQGAGKGIQRGGERTEGAPDGTTLHVGVCSVRQWP